MDSLIVLSHCMEGEGRKENFDGFIFLFLTPYKGSSRSQAS